MSTAELERTGSGETPGGTPEAPRGFLARLTPLVRGSIALRERHPVCFRAVCTVLGVGIVFLIVAQVSATNAFDLGTAAAASVIILGLSFLTGFSGQVSLGNGAFMGVGCYAYAIWAIHHPNSSVAEDLLVATVAGALAGLVIGLPATRLRGPYLAGMTIAAMIAFGSLIDEFSNWTGGDQGLSLNPVTAPGWLGRLIGSSASSLRATYVWRTDIIVAVTGVAFFFMANLFQSRKGRSMRLMRENEVAAELVGVSLPRARVAAFVVAAALAGLGGGLITLLQSTVYSSTFSLGLSIQFLTLLVIGGIGTLSGSLIGGILFAYSITWISELVSGLGLSSQSNLGSQMNGIIFGALLIFTVLVAPLGIAGTVRTARFAISQRLAARHGA